jgi:triacylglycerol lipase
MSINQRYPIVLAQGIARFDILREIIKDKFQLPDNSFDDWLHYFKGIKSYLEQHGFEVYHTNVDFAGGIDLRAQQLAGQINDILRDKHYDKVHLIAHSMGGLDARRMIVDVDSMSGKVASLSTIGTPHLGTSLADAALRFGGVFIMKALEPIIHLDGFADLTIKACAEFNRLRQALPDENSTLRTIGVDDFAFRRGQRYGTLIVDLKQRLPVDLLPDREADTLNAWRKHIPA